MGKQRRLWSNHRQNRRIQCWKRWCHEEKHKGSWVNLDFPAETQEFRIKIFREFRTMDPMSSVVEGRFCLRKLLLLRLVSIDLDLQHQDHPQRDSQFQEGHRVKLLLTTYQEPVKYLGIHRLKVAWNKILLRGRQNWAKRSYSGSKIGGDACECEQTGLEQKSRCYKSNLSYARR